MAINDFQIKEAELLGFLSEIQQKHIDWFSTRPGKLPTEKHDHIGHHYEFYYDGQQLCFNKVGNELQDEIWKECVEAFNKVYQ